MLSRLTSLGVRAPKTVLAAWALVFVVGMVAAGGLFSSLEADLESPSSFESEKVARRLDALEPGGETVAAIVEGAPVDPAVVQRIGARSGVAAVNELPSDDGSATAVVVETAGSLDDDQEDDLVDTVVDDLRAIDAPTVRVGGEFLVDEETGELAEKDAQRAEMVSLPLALLVMAVVFGGLLAAGMPLAIAFGGIGATRTVLAVVSGFTDISLYAVNVTIMLGLGLGIDYGLLLVSRFREERGEGHDVHAAVRRTMASAGRTVVFAASTVAVALFGLLTFEEPTVRSLGIAGIAVVLATMLAALTLMPALLVGFGHRLGATAPGTRLDHGWFARLARLIQRRALPVALLVGVGLAVLAAPFLDARFDAPDVKALPESSKTRQVAEAFDQRFTAFTAEPVEVVADVDPDDPAVSAWVADIAALPDVDGAEVADISVPGTTVVEVDAAGRTNGPRSQTVVREIRDLDTPFPVLVGGDPAEIVDFRSSIVGRLPVALVVIVAATFCLLFAMTGSVVVPIKAIVMNVLSLGATFGALVWIFQDGHLSGLLGFDPPGALDLVMPAIVFVFAFGLSMDYEVFMLSRIREVWDETGDNPPPDPTLPPFMAAPSSPLSRMDRAVAVGLQRSGRIITSAALLMTIVFAGFALGEIVPMKQLGLGLAIAVVVDATIVRSLLVPATMKLMGRWNWWAPPRLARLYRRLALSDA